MNEATDRRALKAEYRESKQNAGVYRVSSSVSGRGIVSSTANLRSIENRVQFAKSTKSLGALDGRLKPVIERDGFDALTFEVLESVEPAAEQSAAALGQDMKTLEQLWREKLGPDALL